MSKKYHDAHARRYAYDSDTGAYDEYPERDVLSEPEDDHLFHDPHARDGRYQAHLHSRPSLPHVGSRSSRRRHRDDDEDAEPRSQGALRRVFKDMRKLLNSMVHADRLREEELVEQVVLGPSDELTDMRIAGETYDTHLGTGPWPPKPYHPPRDPTYRDKKAEKDSKKENKLYRDWLARRDAAVGRRDRLVRGGYQRLSPDGTDRPGRARYAVPARQTRSGRARYLSRYPYQSSYPYQSPYQFL